jgi:hypothetical protein
MLSAVEWKWEKILFYFIFSLPLHGVCTRFSSRRTCKWKVEEWIQCWGDYATTTWNLSRECKELLRLSWFYSWTNFNCSNREALGGAFEFGWNFSVETIFQFIKLTISTYIYDDTTLSHDLHRYISAKNMKVIRKWILSLILHLRRRRGAITTACNVADFIYYPDTCWHSFLLPLTPLFFLSVCMSTVVFYSHSFAILFRTILRVSC